MKIDLYNAPTETLADLLREACLLGMRDERAKKRQRTGDQLCALLVTEHRRGHARLLRSAYRAGRWHEALKENPNRNDIDE